LEILAFLDAAQAVQARAADAGLAPVAFRSDRHRHRTLRRYPDGAVVRIDVTLDDDEVVRAMVEGTLIANGRDPDDALRADLTPTKEELWRS